MDALGVQVTTRRILPPPSFWVAMLLAIFAVAPLLHPGYFWGAHDARHDVFFLQQYNVTWEEGTIFPRWSPDWAFGYGYPFFNIYAPGSAFLGTLLMRGLALTPEAAVKALLILTLLISAWSMWLFVRDGWGDYAAVVAAAAYVYAPYHLVDVYVRAAMAESLALAFLPLALWGARRAVLHPSRRTIAWAAVGYAAVHLSSNLVALIFTPVLGLYILTLVTAKSWRQRSPTDPSQRNTVSARRFGWNWLRTGLPPAAGLILGVALAAFFILPALLESRFVRLDQWFGGYYDFRDHFVAFAQLFDPRWGFGISIPGADDALSYQVGLAAFVLAAVGVFVWRRRLPSRLLERRWEMAFWLIILLGSAWLTTASAEWAWAHLPLVASAQFPWRYLTLAVLALAPLAALAAPSATTLEPAANPQKWLVTLLLAGLIILGSAPYLRIETIEAPRGGATLAGLMEFQRSANEMTGMTITATEIPTWSPLADLHVAGLPIGNQVDYGVVAQRPGLVVDVREHRIASELVWVRAEEAARVPFDRQWYPGWTATMLSPDGAAVIDRFALTPAETRPPYGLLDVPVPAGDHLLHLTFEDTPVRRLANLISLAAALIIVVLFVIPTRNKPQQGRRGSTSP